MLCARARYDEAALQAAYAPLKDAEASGLQFTDQIHLAQAHGLMGEHDKAYASIRAAADSERTLTQAGLYAAAAAAANTGRTQEAKGYYRLYKDNGGSIDREIDSLTAGLPGPNVASAYPYFKDQALIHPPFYLEIMKPIFDALDASVKDPYALLAIDLSEQARRFPQIVWIGEKIFLEEDFITGLGMLMSANDERSVKIVRDLAESPSMTWAGSINAATALRDHGILKDGDTLGIWRDGRRFEIGPDELRALEKTPDMPEDIRDLLQKAEDFFEDDPDRAKAILGGLTLRYPDIPQLHHNMALLAYNEEERQSRLLHALELDPEYDYGRLTLASFHAYAGRPNEAEALLAHFGEDHLFKPLDYVALLYARALIERARRQYEAALILLRQALRENLYFDPAFNMAHRLETALAEGRTDVNSRLNLEEYPPDDLIDPDLP
jgi:hypothetical protein